MDSVGPPRSIFAIRPGRNVQSALAALMTVLGVQLMFMAVRSRLTVRTNRRISAITNGWMIMQVPETLLGTAIATAILRLFKLARGARRLERIPPND